jgi:hypothetical protein
MRRLFAVLSVLALFCAGFVKTTQPCWEDLQFPIVGVNPAGPAAAPTLSTTTGLWTFSGTTDNVAVFTFQMPHGWQKGTEIDPHIHFAYPAGGVATSVWFLEWKAASVFGTFPATYASGTSVISVQTGANVHQLGELIDFTPAVGHSAIIQVQLSRLASSDARDTAGDLVLYAFDAHYLRESNGSFLQYGD